MKIFKQRIFTIIILLLDLLSVFRVKKIVVIKVHIKMINKTIAKIIKVLLISFGFCCNLL